MRGMRRERRKRDSVSARGIVNEFEIEDNAIDFLSPRRTHMRALSAQKRSFGSTKPNFLSESTLASAEVLPYVCKRNRSIAKVPNSASLPLTSHVARQL